MMKDNEMMVLSIGIWIRECQRRDGNLNLKGKFSASVFFMVVDIGECILDAIVNG